MIIFLSLAPQITLSKLALIVHIKPTITAMSMLLRPTLLPIYITKGKATVEQYRLLQTFHSRLHCVKDSRLGIFTESPSIAGHLAVCKCLVANSNFRAYGFPIPS